MQPKRPTMPARRRRVRAATLLAAATCFAGAAQAGPDANADGLRFFSPIAQCRSDCAFSLYAGRFLDTAMKEVFGVDGFTPPHDWRWGSSSFVAATVGRPVLRYGDLFAVEVEIGAGKRFGALKSPEVWGALYFRWTKFPWNHIVRTSVAVSTGLNYAPGRDAIETARMQNGGQGSRLMHFLSPEITFGLPHRPDVDVFFRLHHRSGGRDVFGPVSLFNGAGGGTQYNAIGVRARF